MARKSLTFVSVGPMRIASPTASKNPWLSWAASMPRGSRPLRARPGRACPAPTLRRRYHPFRRSHRYRRRCPRSPALPSSASARPRRNVVLRPPRPLAFEPIETVVSPPDSMTAGGATGSPWTSDRSSDPGVDDADLSRLALQRIAQNQRGQTHVPRQSRRQPAAPSWASRSSGIRYAAGCRVLGFRRRPAAIVRRPREMG